MGHHEQRWTTGTTLAHFIPCILLQSNTTDMVHLMPNDVPGKRRWQVRIHYIKPFVVGGISWNNDADPGSSVAITDVHHTICDRLIAIVDWTSMCQKNFWLYDQIRSSDTLLRHIIKNCQSWRRAGKYVD